MFDQATAAGFIGFLGSLFNPALSIGNFTIYPLIQTVVFLVFNVICLIVFFTIQLIYIIKDKINKMKSR